MLRLKKLKLKGFRSFEKEASIDFPTSGLLLIRGSNETNGDPSGTGKSTVMLAIAYALDICPFSATDLQTWGSEVELQVQLTLDTDRGEATIWRGKKNRLEIGDKVVTGAKNIAEEIKSLTGLTPEVLSALTYRAQNTRGLFLSLTDSEKKDFLTKILGLDSIENAVEVAETAVRTLTPAVEIKKASMLSLEDNLKTLQTRSFPEPLSIPNDVAEAVAANEGVIFALQKEILDLRKAAVVTDEQIDADAEVKRLRAVSSAALNLYTNAIEADKRALSSFKENQQNLRSQAEVFVRKEGETASLRKKVEVLKKQVAHALEGKCHTCFRVWDEAKTSAEALTQEILSHEETISSLAFSPEERAQILQALRESFVPDSNIEKLREVIGATNLSISTLIQELKNEPQLRTKDAISELEVKRATIMATHNGHLHLIRTIEESNSRMETARVAHGESLARCETQLEVARREYTTAMKELNAEKDFITMMGREGFLGVIFDEVLREIESETNSRLSLLANVSHVTIQFKSEVQTQKGTTKRSITPIAFVNGQEAKLDSGLSGGMYTSVESQVDLALTAVVQRRTGAIPGFLFLDEAFNGQGNVTKEAVMEGLREYAEDKLVVVIDHNSEMKEMFSMFVDVCYSDGRSRIA